MKTVRPAPGEQGSTQTRLAELVVTGRFSRQRSLAVRFQADTEHHRVGIGFLPLLAPIFAQLSR